MKRSKTKPSSTTGENGGGGFKAGPSLLPLRRTSRVQRPRQEVEEEVGPCLFLLTQQQQQQQLSLSLSQQQQQQQRFLSPRSPPLDTNHRRLRRRRRRPRQCLRRATQKEVPLHSRKCILCFSSFLEKFWFLIKVSVFINVSWWVCGLFV